MIDASIAPHPKMYCDKEKKENLKKGKYLCIGVKNKERFDAAPDGDVGQHGNDEDVDPS